MTLSQRAMVRETPRDARDLNRLREEWRLIAEEAARAETQADRLEEGRKILYAELIKAMTDGGMPKAKAEVEARVCEKFKAYVRHLYDMKENARLLSIRAKDASMAYYEQKGSEETQRSERWLARG